MLPHVREGHGERGLDVSLGQVCVAAESILLSRAFFFFFYVDTDHQSQSKNKIHNVFHKFSTAHLLIQKLKKAQK